MNERYYMYSLHSIWVKEELSGAQTAWCKLTSSASLSLKKHVSNKYINKFKY